MIEIADTVKVEESTTIEQPDMVMIPSEVYENLVRESERMRIIRNYFWFTVEEDYCSTYSVDNILVAALFDDEEFLFGKDKVKFTRKIGKLVHDALDPKRKESK